MIQKKKKNQTLVRNDNSTINYGSYQNQQNAFLFVYSSSVPYKITIVGINPHKITMFTPCPCILRHHITCHL